MRIKRHLYISILDEEGGAFVVLGVDDCIIDAEKRIEEDMGKRREPRPRESYRIVEAVKEREQRHIRKIGAVRAPVSVVYLCIEQTGEGWRQTKNTIDIQH